MSKQVRVNVRHAIDNSAIRRERRDGRDYLVVPSATMPDGIVMNRIRYSADAISKAFGSLENTPAPLGHPTIEGAFVSAKDPEGLARGWIGAWNRNVRRENGRVFMDKVIDVATANQLDGGKTVLDAIEKGEPIHSSTGLYAVLTAVSNDADADWDASDISFDHDAILIGEDGAATPAQGVGLMVNGANAADGEGKIDVINSAIEDDIDREMMWSVESLLRSAERKERLPLLERIKSFIEGLVSGSSVSDIDPNATKGMALNQENEAMDKAQFDELVAKVDGLANAQSPGLTKEEVTEIVANALKPITDAEAARVEAERTVVANKVVEAGLLDEATAKTADIAVLNALAEKIGTDQPAFRVNGAFKAPADKADRGSLAPKGE